MKIVHIFEGKLHAVHHENESIDEWHKLAEVWTDLTWLESFFEEHKNDLVYFGCSVEEAVMITLEDADDIFQYIEELAGTGSFDSAFVNLDNNEYHTIQLSKKKAKGRRRKSWLRVYAIKIATDVFLITGGAIKLTKTMKEREHTQRELTKLEKCKSFLQENGIIDEDSFWELLDI